MVRMVSLVVALLLAAPFWLHAKSEKPERTFEIKMEPVDDSKFDKDRTITVQFKIIDPRTGKLAEGLPKLKVIVKEDGRDVYQDTWEPNREPPPPPPTPPPEPIWSVMVLDCSASMLDRNKMNDMKLAAKDFIRDMPSEAADMTIVTFSDDVQTMDPPFTDKYNRQLVGKIDSLKFVGETRLYDAIIEGIDTVNAAHNPNHLTEDGKPFRGRRYVVALTDGMDTHSRRRHQDVIRLAQKLNVKVYTIGFGEQKDVDEKVLQEIATQTGGEFFYAKDRSQLQTAFQRVAKAQSEERRVYVPKEPLFTITYHSPRDIHDGSQRRIEIFLENLEGGKGPLAQAKGGYGSHGLITPQPDYLLYLIALGSLVALLAFPGLMRRLVYSR